MEMSPTQRDGRPTSAVPWTVYQMSSNSRTKANERARTHTKCTSFWTSGKVSRNTRLQVSPDPNLCPRLRDHDLVLKYQWLIWTGLLYASERTTVPKVVQTKTKRSLRARNAKKISYAKMMAMDSEGEEEEESSSDFIASESDCSTSAGVGLLTAIVKRCQISKLQRKFYFQSEYQNRVKYSNFLFFILLLEPDPWADGGGNIGQWSLLWGRTGNTTPRLQQNL